MEKYFVLISNEYFGVFKTNNVLYPYEFTENIENVKSISELELRKYLIENVGRNTLIRQNFSLFYSIGEVFRR